MPSDALVRKIASTVITATVPAGPPINHRGQSDGYHNDGRQR
jgi:hypothetical protein